MRGQSLRKILFLVWLASLPSFVFLWCLPTNSLRIRLAIVAALGVFSIGILVIEWRRPFIRYGLLGAVFLILIFLLIPASKRSQDTSWLRYHYTISLLSYKESPYMWGGEGKRGMDCSGLTRRAMEDVLLNQGMRTFSPFYFREAGSLWWNDTTAEVMGQGYEGRMEFLVQTPSLNGLDTSLLKPGDVAVTADGVHIMAYLGSNQWIGADPTEGKVTVFTVPEERSAYFSMPMNIMRWKVLKE